MGNHRIDAADSSNHEAFIRALLRDLQALETMIERELFECGVRRIGAEQEMFLVDSGFQPAGVAMEVLEKAQEPALTTELARYNLEANLSPRRLQGHCFRDMEAELNDVLAKTRVAAAEFQADVVLTGILPTMQLSDLTLENITPHTRYRRLNDVLVQQRGTFPMRIKGLDEFNVVHDNVMFESCNTSFQVHLQVDPGEFARMYNLAQAMTAPVLAAAVNSPILLQKRLWHETRVALFQAGVDERSDTHRARGQRARVRFGDRWVRDSVVELFQEEIARHRVLLTNEVGEDPREILERNEIPPLSALQLHNGTVYLWNRPCYGTTHGIPHLRIENRALPAGPTVIDEVANAALFLGLLMARKDEDITQRMSFEDAKHNFLSAARHGLDTQLRWTEGRQVSASTLLLEELLPQAEEGLCRTGVSESDARRCLKVVRERVEKGATGSRWILDSIRAMESQVPMHHRLHSVTAGMARRQWQGTPVHHWPLAGLEDSPDWKVSFRYVEQFMSTDLFTLQPEDLIDMAASVMTWEHIRHIPVEDDAGRLQGLVSCRDLTRLLTRPDSSGKEAVRVREIMKENPVTVTPRTSTLEAAEIMKRSNLGCLPVVEGDRLVGIITVLDLMRVAARLFQAELSR